MKRLFVLFLLLNYFAFAQETEVKGKIIDAETNNPLFNANVFVKEKPSIGTASDKEGNFTLENIPLNGTLTVSYIGYNSKEINLSEIKLRDESIIKLEPKIIPAQTVLVEGSIAKEGVTPVTSSKITREEIEEDYTVQDIPEFLSTLPSTTFYSEGGNGIGYNYLSIRGFDQRRISVSINGIPQNDPEDHNVYWLDFPDLLASTDLIQVQRGAGSGVSGYPAIGGSINIITSTFSNNPKLNFSASLGSYNTRKYSASFSSGIIDKKYSVYAKLSQILSSGYRNDSWVKFNSYHISAVRYDENITTQVNFFGGPIEDGLAYTGLPKFAVKDKDLRKANYSDWGVDPATNSFTYTVLRRPVEIENFSQPHFELLNEFNLDDNITLNSALFLVLGDGFFDYDASWSVFYDDYFRLQEGGFDQSFTPANALIRAKVENTQYGFIPRLSWKHNNGELIVGSELRFHKSNHWGRIQYANNLPPDYNLDRYYYYYNGKKDILNTFIHETYNLTQNINLLGEIQFAYHSYRLYNEKFIDTDFSVSDFFINPRAGINYRFNENHNLYFSYARVTREPRLKNYYDAAESSAGEVPQFKQNPDGSFDFSNPLVKPETMNDFELGTSFTSDYFSLSLNLFYMSFDNEIVKSGQVDRFGQPITGNVDNTLHRGIEFTGRLRLPAGLEILGNFTYSKNTIEDGSTFIEYTDPVSESDLTTELGLSGNRISSFPDILGNLAVSYKNHGIFLQVTGKYVGDFYSDNYDDNINEYVSLYPGFISYLDNKNEAYFVADFTASYEFRLFNSLSPAKVYVQVNNIFDNLYSAYAIGKEFFPAAERNFLVGLQLGI